MTVRNRPAPTFYFICALAIIGVFMLVYFKKGPKNTLPIFSAPLIQELMLDGRAIQFDENGQKTQELKIEKVSHAKGEDLTHFTQPQVCLSQPDGSSWTLNAKIGKSIHASDGNRLSEIELFNQVTLRQFSENTDAWQLSTEAITVYPKTKTIYTNKTVTMSNNEFNISGDGLSGDMNTQKIVLLNNVKAQYHYHEN